MDSNQIPCLLNVPDISDVLSQLSTLPRRQQKRALGQLLHPLVYNVYPNFMSQTLINILLDINSISGLVNMINDSTFFHTKLKEAVTVFETYYGMRTNLMSNNNNNYFL
ncbi:hypothetical protein PUN28_017581 [Cardiocondyla obscurior]|uniref:PABC domain-containing protein n=1 Tax=Cardiocondyla obscurior TaxID=286306 RepID=A0AAW2EKA1_9HYME